MLLQQECSMFYTTSYDLLYWAITPARKLFSWHKAKGADILWFSPTSVLSEMSRRRKICWVSPARDAGGESQYYNKTKIEGGVILILLSSSVQGNITLSRHKKHEYNSLNFEIFETNHSNQVNGW